MKRFHVHLSVQDLDASVRFYSTLFAADPSVHEREYAKWLLEDPRVNFAISTRSGSPGIDHLGIQAEDAGELAELGARLQRAGEAVVAEPGAECCHARSDKVWSQDPQGTRWETFHTVGSITSYHGQDGVCELASARAADLVAMAGRQGATPAPAKNDASACCDETTPQGVCCAPKPGLAADAACCGPAIASTKARLQQAACALSGCGSDGRR